jgi:hypothetical protein
MVAGNAGDTGRRGEAERRADALAPRLSKLTITVAGVPAPGLEVRRDGAIVGEGQFGTAVPVDAGEHVIEASAPGRQVWSLKAHVAEGAASVAVAVPELAFDTGGVTSPGTPATDISPSPPRPFWISQRVAGVAVGSLGVAGLAVGAALGGLAASKNSASKADCLPNQPNVCHADGVSLRASAGTFADASTGAFVAGGVALATGIIVFAASPKGATTKTGAARRIEVFPTAGLGTAGFWLRGAW